MPYIPQTKRPKLDLYIDNLEPKNAGELNYTVTRLVLNYVGLTPSYETFNEAIGVLESSKLELYRKQIAPYEDMKIRQNGDV